MRKLKYIGYAIGLQEVPDEISLIFNVSGCPYHCDGCHSQYLWKYDGRYLKEDVFDIINDNKDGLSCVCFMGGDQNIEELEDILTKIKSNYNLKTALYTGCDIILKFYKLIAHGLLDYLKVGKYDSKLGGLNSKNTNQRMYKINGNSLNDITYLFSKNRM